MNKQRILDNLIQLFLSSQEKIKSLPEGSVARAILYAAASGLEDVYEEISTTINKLYIDKASGENLDALIEGFVGLKRLPATRSIGYAIVEFGEPLTDANINRLSFSFSRYVSETDTLTSDIPG